MTTATDPSPSHLLTAARRWFDAGFCVIPSHEDGSKRPFGRWKEYQQHRPAWGELEGWLTTGRYTGIGVICGAASGGAEMVEIEGPSDKAVERLGRVMAAATACDLADLMATVARGCVEQSAGGGLHMVIRIGDGAAKPNTKLANAGTGSSRHVVAETRGEGGFVIVAPTPGRNGHPEGSTYLFLQGSGPEGTPTISAKERDELHDLLTYALDEAEPERAASPAPAHSTPSSPVAVDSTFGEFRASTTWRDILAPLGWREGPTIDGRTHWTRPGGTSFEGTSATTIEDGPMFCFSTSVDLPAEQGLSKEYVHAHMHHGGDLKAASAALREQGYGQAVVPVLAPWDGPLPEVADMTPEQVAAEVKVNWVLDRLPRVDWNILWADERDEEWIVEPLLAARRLVALYSAPKVGKSLLMLEVAAAVACGRGMFGYPAGPPRRTLYVDMENDPRGDVRQRLIDMGYGPGDLDNLVLLSFPTLAKLDTEQGSVELMAAVETYACEIVVIDTVSRTIEGEENSNDTWLSFYKFTGLKMKQAGISLIRLDHSGKDDSKGQRGGSAKSGDVDAVWRLSRNGDDLFDLECEAMRFPISDKLITLRRMEDPLRHVVTTDAYKQRRDSLLASLSVAGMPKDPDMTLNEAKRWAKDRGVKLGKSGFFNADLWDRYRSQPSIWSPSTTSDGE